MTGTRKARDDEVSEYDRKAYAAGADWPEVDDDGGGRTMTEEQGYNGWKNYETWSVALILDNDEGLQRAAVRCVEDAVRFGKGSEYWTEDMRKVYRSAEYLKRWIEQYAEIEVQIRDDMPMSFLWSQLVSAALSEVDWDEVARHYLEAVTEQVTT